jgi:predicted phosphodiesterase
LEIAVISDLHLGQKDDVDGFGHDDADFLRFLSFLEQNFERIVLLGDIWETLTDRCPWAARLALEQSRAAHPEIAQRFRRPMYQYVHGNHDLIARHVDGAPEHWICEADGRRMLFTHGHLHDRLFRFARHLAELGICLGAWLRRTGCHALYRWFEDMERTRPSDVAPDSSFQAWAMDAASSYAADIVVTGHTHLPSRVDSGVKLHLNSGSCSGGRFSYLGLDTRADRYGVHLAW